LIVESNVRGDEDPQLWFRQHYEDAADQVLAFLGDSSDSPLEGKVMADVGCGDGIIDLGLAIKGRPKKLVGFDVRLTDVDALRRSAEVAGVADELPENLMFATSGEDSIPAQDDSFDVVVTWSVFEHVSEPVRMLSEVARVLRPGGVLFLQLWPFFYSEHGGHLWPHYEEPFPHLLQTDAELRAHLVGRRATDPTREALDEYESLNRIDLDGLQRALLSAGLRTVKLELLTNAVHIPLALSHLPLSVVGIAGVKLLAVSPAQPAQAAH
jgi:ubiquinone/menaquinone biosynthesis C-methylase UbiE